MVDGGIVSGFGRGRCFRLGVIILVGFLKIGLFSFLLCLLLLFLGLIWVSENFLVFFFLLIIILDIFCFFLVGLLGVLIFLFLNGVIFELYFMRFDFFLLFDVLLFFAVIEWLYKIDDLLLLLRKLYCKCWLFYYI